MSALQQWGIALIQSIQTLSPALDGLMEIITFFGRVEFYMVFIPFLYWLVNREWGFRTFLALLAVDSVSSSLKTLLHQPRPYWVSKDVTLIGSPESSYGIPSAHASNPPVVLGYLAASARKSWLWVVAIVAALLISFSRLYLAVHFPHDVLAGWLIAAVVLALILRWERDLVKWLKTKTSGFKIRLSFAISLLYIALGALIIIAIAGTPDPEAWAGYAVEARSLDHTITLAGAFFGSTSGYVAMRRWANFRSDGELVQKILRYVLGIVGVVIVLYGLDILFERLTAELIAGYMLRYVRYAATTFWVMCGAPWVFLRLKLAEKQPGE